VRLSALAVLLTTVVVGCGVSATSSRQPVELTVFAAASLAPALEAVQTEYERANAGTTLVLSTDSSAALATQIEQGAPADVFLSADTTNPQKLVDRGLASGDAVVFAGNALTVIVPADDPAAIESPADLARPGVQVVAAGDEVPITRYAAELAANLADLAGYPATFPLDYAANVVSKEDNVKAVVAKIELGEGDAAIVYVTDAAASEDVATVEVPDDANVRASYAGIVVEASPDQAAATAFLDWLAGPDGQGILARFGFLPRRP
jgi:molybdate transport system substrate-binding protein